MTILAKRSEERNVGKVTKTPDSGIPESDQLLSKIPQNLVRTNLTWWQAPMSTLDMSNLYMDVTPRMSTPA